MTEQQLQQLHEEYVDLQVVKVYLKNGIKCYEETRKTIENSDNLIEYCKREIKKINKRQDEIRKIMSKNV